MKLNSTSHWSLNTTNSRWKEVEDISRDEPFLVPVRNKPFAVVPYTIHTNDIVNYEARHWTGAQFANELKYEFDQLYAEAAKTH